MDDANKGKQDNIDAFSPGQAFLQRMTSSLTPKDDSKQLGPTQEYVLTSTTLDGKAVVTYPPHIPVDPNKIEEGLVLKKINKDVAAEILEQEATNLAMFSKKHTELRMDFNEISGEIQELKIAEQLSDEIKKNKLSDLLEKCDTLLNQSEEKPTLQDIQKITSSLEEIKTFLSQERWEWGDSTETNAPTTDPQVIENEQSPSLQEERKNEEVILPQEISPAATATEDKIETTVTIPEEIQQTPSSPEMLTQFTQGQIYYVRADNIGRESQTRRLVIERLWTENGWKPIKPTMLSKDQISLLQTSNNELDKYKGFIEKVGKGEVEKYAGLINAKINLITAIEAGEWSEVENKRNTLKQTLEEIKNPVVTPVAPVQQTGEPQQKIKKGSVLRPTQPPDEDDAAREWDDFTASQRTEDEIDDARKRKTIVLRKSSTLSSVPRNPEQLKQVSQYIDVAGGWPTTIFRKEVGGTKGLRGRIDWYRADNDGKESRLQNINEWNAFYDEFSLLFKDYTDLMLTGRLAERVKKAELFTSLVQTKNEAVGAISVGDLEKAKSLFKIFTQEILDAQEKWDAEKPKAAADEKRKIENEKEREIFKKNFEDNKKQLIKADDQATQLKRELTSDLERQHIDRELDEIKRRFELAEETLSKIPVDKNLLDNAVTGLTEFSKTLTAYENKVSNMRKFVTEAGRQGSLRPTVLRDSNKTQLVKRIGKPDISVEDWTNEQEIVRKELQKKEQEAAEKLKRERYVEYEYEFLHNPEAYYLKYVLENKKSIVDQVDKKVIEEVLAKGVSEGKLREKEIKELEQKFKLHWGEPSKVLYAEKYSPAIEAADKGLQAAIQDEEKEVGKLIDTEKKAIENLNGPETLAAQKATDDAIEARRKEGADLHTNGMTNAANMSQENHAEPGDGTYTASTTSISRSPETEKKTARVSEMHEKATKFFGSNWKRFVAYLVIGGAAALVQDEMTKNSESVQPDTATQEKSPMKWRDYMPQTQEAKDFLNDIETLSAEKLVVKYVPSYVVSTNPASVSTFLNMMGSDILFSQDEVYGLTVDQRLQASNMLSRLVQVYGATNAPELSRDTLHPGVLSSTIPGYQQNNYGGLTPGITIEKFIAQVKTAMYKADQNK